MPNHVTNAIVFRSMPEFTFAEDKLINKEGHVDFELLVPTPPNVYHGNLSSEDERDFGNFNWYDWNRENWGTKWNAYDTEVVVERMIIRFDTAWSPPYPIVVALSRHVPNFIHYYIEETCESWGKEVWREGSRVAYWKNDPDMYETIFEIVNGAGAWERIAEDHARDAEEYPDEGLTWPPDLSGYTPTIKLPSKALGESI